MIKEVSITVTPEQEHDAPLIKKIICSTLEHNGTRVNANDASFVFVKKSIDARHSHIKLILKYKVYIGEKPGDNTTNMIGKWKPVDGQTISPSSLTLRGRQGLFGAFQTILNTESNQSFNRAPDSKNRLYASATFATISNARNCLEGDMQPTVLERRRRRGKHSATAKTLTPETSNPSSGNIDNNSAQLFGLILAQTNQISLLTPPPAYWNRPNFPAIINGDAAENNLPLVEQFHFNTKCVSFHQKNNPLTITGRTHTKHNHSGRRKIILGDAVLLATGHSRS